MRKSYPPAEFELQPLDYRSTALPLELERMSLRMLNFGCLNPVAVLMALPWASALVAFRPEACKTIQ